MTTATRYHIGRNGKPSVCRADQGNCPLRSTPHFDSKDKADFYIEAQGDVLGTLTPTERTAYNDQITRYEQGLAAAKNAQPGKPIPVESSSLESIEYDKEARVMNLVFAKSGDRYTYRNVPADVFESFVASDSKGHFFLENIRDQYPAS